MINAQDFIQKVRIPLQQQWGYIYGTWGRMWTAALQQAFSQPTRTNWKKTKMYGSKWIGRMVTDCSGLVRWACHQLGEEVAHQSHYLYTDYCRNKGKLVNGLRADGTEPLTGSLVFLVNAQGRKHHVGVYVGDNIVIEAKGTQYGVVTSQLAHWNAWGELNCVSYTNDAPPAPIDNATYAIAVNPGKYLNMRAEPNLKGARVATIPQGQRVKVLEQTNNEWWKVEYAGHVGYSMCKYLKII